MSIVHHICEGVSAIELPPVEWDFRKLVQEIPAKDMPLLVDYEYARQNKAFAAEFRAWKKSTVPGWDTVNGTIVSSEDGKKFMVGDLLNRGFDNLPPELQQRLRSSYPGMKFWESFEWLPNFPGFPAPFDRRGRNWSMPEFPTVPICFAPSGQWPHTGWSPPINPKHYTVQIEWAHSDRDIIKSFSAWLEKARPPGSKIFENRGKKRVPYYRLRNLAAWRLHSSRGKMTVNGLLKALEKYRTQRPVNNQCLVFPDFNDEHMFGRAVGEAKEYATELCLEKVSF
jgi:hypothetical protein